ncbi:hypothetical protein AXX17_ATUG02560 (mitochondrion) [Arabidopsis thaliana]|uniref:Uncharacterized protein n=1 Tax=Arabidopsis thaliana TaxID=3702 RepID=A0A178U7P0_ARATH|nr:hypothetical protein AXX17_ATUG02560 [Arabidopsis thaliana]
MPHARDRTAIDSLQAVAPSSACFYYLIGVDKPEGPTKRSNSTPLSREMWTKAT